MLHVRLSFQMHDSEIQFCILDGQCSSVVLILLRNTCVPVIRFFIEQRSWRCNIAY